MRSALAEAPAVLAAASAASWLSFLLLLLALEQGGAGLVLTLRNTSVVFALLWSWALGHRPGPRQAVGSVLVAGGALLLGHRS